MAYFPDLFPYSYASREPDPSVLMVGWLDKGAEFPRGSTTTEFREALGELVAEHRMRLFRGWHTCHFCTENFAHGNGEIRVRKAGAWYAAPVMVAHYVTAHDYLPPPEFIAAVLAPDQIGSDENAGRDY